MNDRHPESDTAGRARALNLATLRAVVAAYLLYLGVSTLVSLAKGESSLSPLFGWSIGILFTGSALAFGWYTWKRWRTEQDVSGSVQPSEPDSDS